MWFIKQYNFLAAFRKAASTHIFRISKKVWPKSKKECEIIPHFTCLLFCIFLWAWQRKEPTWKSKRVSRMWDNQERLSAGFCWKISFMVQVLRAAEYHNFSEISLRQFSQIYYALAYAWEEVKSNGHQPWKGTWNAAVPAGEMENEEQQNRKCGLHRVTNKLKKLANNGSWETNLGGKGM